MYLDKLVFRAGCRIALSASACSVVVALLLSAYQGAGARAGARGVPGAISFNATVPPDIADPSDPRQAATFAWQEFIALTWPAATNPSPTPGMSPYLRGRAAPQATSGSTGAGGTVVWETFYHRVELYPGYSQANQQLPDPNAAPNYLYRAPIAKATPTTDVNAFNNLDEASEINIAQMYYTPFAQQAQALIARYPNPTPVQQAMITAAATKAAILYEAKANPTIFNYVKSTSFNNLAPRRAALVNAVNTITNKPVTGPAFALPTGSIEIKATWRRYDSAQDNLNAYHWTKGLYYTTNASGGLVAHNDILLLISLHIIHKTPNVPTFTFATFEHVSDEANGFRFFNNNPQTSLPPGYPRPLPDKGLITAARQFPIPGTGSGFDLNAFNLAVQAQIRNQFGGRNVWANYRLIGVQALVQDDPGGKVPPQQFFLSNFATETNDTLQFFQGGLGGTAGNVPAPNAGGVFTMNAATHQYQPHTAGGCLGCHGAAGQKLGGDFSVIATTGNRFAPEAITPYPGGALAPQNPAGFPLPRNRSAALRTAGASFNRGK